jgi:hypothetical protein
MSEKPKRNQHKDVDWEQVRLAVEGGVMSYAELAARLGIPKGTIAARVHREGWKVAPPANTMQAAFRAHAEELRSGSATSKSLPKTANNYSKPPEIARLNPEIDGKSPEIAVSVGKSPTLLPKRSPSTAVLGAIVDALREQGLEYQKIMAEKALSAAKFMAAMDDETFLRRSDDVDRVDRLARRTFGLDKSEVQDGKLVINLAVLQGGEEPRSKGVIDV